MSPVGVDDREEGGFFFLQWDFPLLFEGIGEAIAYCEVGATQTRPPDVWFLLS